MSKVISTTIELITPKLPPCVEFIEEEFSKMGIKPVRWAITKIIENKLILSVSHLVDS